MLGRFQLSFSLIMSSNIINVLIYDQQSTGSFISPLFVYEWNLACHCSINCIIKLCNSRLKVITKMAAVYIFPSYYAIIIGAQGA